MLAWACAVLFSDNAADFAALKELTEQRNTLAARRDEMEACFSANARSCQVCCCFWPAALSGCCKPACTMHQTQESLRRLHLMTEPDSLFRHATHVTQSLQQSALQNQMRITAPGAHGPNICTGVLLMHRYRQRGECTLLNAGRAHDARTTGAQSARHSWVRLRVITEGGH